MIRYKSEVNRLLSLLESKDHLIDKLDLDDEKKQTLKDFFKKYPTAESKINWNRKDLKWEDFTELLNNEGKSKSQAKKTGIQGLVEGEDYEILFKNGTYTIYYPLTHLGSKVLASDKTAPGTVGKWCISMNNDGWWNDYASTGYDFFFIFFKHKQGEERKNLKFAVSRYLSYPWKKPEEDPFFNDPEFYLQRLSVFNEADTELDPGKNFNLHGVPFKTFVELIRKTPNILFERSLNVMEQNGYKIISQDKDNGTPKIFNIIITKQAEDQTINLPLGMCKIMPCALAMPDGPVNVTIDLPKSIFEIGAWGLAGLTQEELVLPPKCNSIQPFAIANSNVKVVRYSDEALVLHFTAGSFLNPGKEIRPESHEANELLGKSYDPEDPRLITLEWPGLLDTFIMAMAQAEFLGPDDFNYIDNTFNLTRYGIGKVVAEGQTFTKFSGTFPFIEWLGMVGWSVSRMGYDHDSADSRYPKYRKMYQDIYPEFFPKE